MNIAQLAAKFPRVSLTPFPTPFHETPRLAAAIGNTVRIFMKRDDVMTLGFGGNKIRKLEFSLGKLLADKCDCLVHGLAAQSNYCRQTAAACAKIGIECHLVLRDDDTAGEPPQSNRLLDHVFGAKVTMVPAEKQQQAKDDLVAKLQAEGRKPYLVGEHDEVLGAIGYALALEEMLQQAAALNITPDILCVTGSRGTQAGLILGKRLLNFKGQILAFDVSPSPDEIKKRTRIANLVNQAAAILNVPETFTIEDVHNSDAHAGPRYGIPTPDCLETLALLGRTEGIPVGPAYTAKGLTGLLHAIRTGRIEPGKTAIFLHTGGTPEIFGFPHQITAALHQPTT